jgi:hypothetical protein
MLHLKLLLLVDYPTLYRQIQDLSQYGYRKSFGRNLKLYKACWLSIKIDFKPIELIILYDRNTHIPTVSNVFIVDKGPDILLLVKIRASNPRFKLFTWSRC